MSRIGISVNYGGRDYGGNVWVGSYRIELSQIQAPTRPKDAAFPHDGDIVRVKYHYVPSVCGTAGIMSEAQIMGATLEMSVEAARELAHLLLDSLEQAKLAQAPVMCTVNRAKKSI